MSKLGKKAILLPKESSVKMEGDSLLISGPKGTHRLIFNNKMFSSKTNEKNEFLISPLLKDKKTSLMWGTYRSLINNAVLGVTKGVSPFIINTCEFLFNFISAGFIASPVPSCFFWSTISIF